MYIKTKLGVVVLLLKNAEYLRSSTKILLSTAMFFKIAYFEEILKQEWVFDVNRELSYSL